MLLFAFALFASTGLIVSQIAEEPRPAVTHAVEERAPLLEATPVPIEAAAQPAPGAGQDPRLDRIWVPLPCTRVGQRMVC